jgi:hypothetical protein
MTTTMEQTEGRQAFNSTSKHTAPSSEFIICGATVMSERARVFFMLNKMCSEEMFTIFPLNLDLKTAASARRMKIFFSSVALTSIDYFARECLGYDATTS